MPTFPDPAQPPQYPNTLDALKNIQKDAADPETNDPDETAFAEDINFVYRNLVAMVSDLRAFIIAFGLDPDALPNGQTMADAATDILARIAAAGGGGGGGFDFISGKASGTPTISYQQPVSGTKAKFQNDIVLNPSPGYQTIFSTFFDSSGNPIAGPNVRVTFVIGGPIYQIMSPGAVNVRIDGSAVATLNNIVLALNDPALQTNFGFFAALTWTASVIGGNFIQLEQDFTGIFPNNNNGIDGTSSPGVWKADKVSYAGGVDDIPEGTTDVVLLDYDLTASSSGPSITLFASRIIVGTHTPETAPVITGDPIIDEPNVSFGGGTHRFIFIPPTEDLVTGSALVEWFWNGKPFSAEVTKTIS